MPATATQVDVEVLEPDVVRLSIAGGTTRLDAAGVAALMLRLKLAGVQAAAQAARPPRPRYQERLPYRDD